MSYHIPDALPSLRSGSGGSPSTGGCVIEVAAYYAAATAAAAALRARVAALEEAGDELCDVTLTLHDHVLEEGGWQTAVISWRELKALQDRWREVREGKAKD